MFINNFNFNHTIRYDVINIIGERNSGKSYLCKSIIEKFYQIPLVIIIHPQTEYFFPFYSNLNNIVSNNDFNLETETNNLIMKKGILLFDHYDNKIIRTLLKRQILLHELNNEKKNKDVLLIIDDLLYTDKIINEMKELFSNTRNYHITIVISCKNLEIFPPHIRCCFTYTFLLYDTINIKKKYNKIINKYKFENFEIFKKLFEELTINFNAMVICNYKNTNKLEEFVYYYNALQN